MKRFRHGVTDLVGGSAVLGLGAFAIGKIPGVKVGKGWRFIEQDLVIYMRSKYSGGVTSQGAVHRREQQWRFTKEIQFGGLVSPIKDREYKEALGLATK